MSVDFKALNYLPVLYITKGQGGDVTKWSEYLRALHIITAPHSRLYLKFYLFVFGPSIAKKTHTLTRTHINTAWN